MNYIQPEYTKEKVLKNVKRTGIGAVIILILIVLPAEYNIDMTGFGKLTGLTKLAEISQEENGENISSLSEEEFNQEKIELLGNQVEQEKTQNIEKKDNVINRIITLGPKSNIEIKYKMNKGDKIQFSWSTTETVYLDQHGEPTTSEDREFLPYKSTKTGKYTRDSDSLVAEFTGTHGWYWRNLSNKTIEINLTIKGQFEEK